MTKTIILLAFAVNSSYKSKTKNARKSTQLNENLKVEIYGTKRK
jgi:hypothetical protein